MCLASTPTSMPGSAIPARGEGKLLLQHNHLKIKTEWIDLHSAVFPLTTLIFVNHPSLKLSAQDVQVNIPFIFRQICAELIR